MKRKPLLYLFFAWMLLIWLLSSLPAKSLPNYDIFGFDKILHLGIYFIWGILAQLCLGNKSPFYPRGMWLLVFMICLAALDEYHQIWIPGRSVSIYDFFANALGLILAFGLGQIFFKKSQK